MRPTFPCGGFGYALNYPKEIAYDKTMIARYERLIELGLYRPASMTTPHGTAGGEQLRGYRVDIVDLALYVDGWATTLGLSSQDLADLAFATDRDVSDELAALQINGKQPYRSGKVIADRLLAIWEDDLLTASEVKRALRKAKADLARHERNQRKYGRTI